MVLHAVAAVGNCNCVRWWGWSRWQLVKHHTPRCALRLRDARFISCALVPADVAGSPTKPSGRLQRAFLWQRGQ